MAFNQRRLSVEQREASAEKRRIEDAAPRLRAVVPGLKVLRMRCEERRAQGQVTSMPYTRHVVVASAPALFTVRCSEPRCSGIHEVTGAVLKALRAHDPNYHGESACQGDVGDNPCDRTLVYVCEAEFGAEPASALHV